LIVTVFYTSFPKNARGKGTIWNARASEMILNALRVALRIDSGIMILICISAKPAGLAEMLFSQEGA
jgi:hypothetical protein